MTKSAGNHGKAAKGKGLDINKKFLIIKSSEDIKKLIKNDNPTNEEISEMQSLLENSELKDEKKKKKRRDIAIPRFKICENDDYKLTKFEKPTHYIRYELYRDQVTGIRLSDGCIIHYDLLKEDEIFLESLNSYMNIHVSNDDFCKLMDKFEKLTGYSENKEEINLKDALNAASELKINYKSNIIKDIHTYWKAKRKKLGRPLLRMFWNNAQNILSHYSVFRSRVKEKMTLRKHKKKNGEVIVKMQELIEDFKRLDRILRKMKQRDEKKLLLLQLNSILFDQRKNEIKDKTYVCPMWDYFKDYKIDKIYKKFKKDKHYKNLHANNNHVHHHHNHNHNSIHSRKINKKNDTIKDSSFSEHMYSSRKINPNEYKNVVLIKRRGRNNRLWIDRKYINNNEMDNVNDLNYYCDLSYVINDHNDDPPSNLKKNYNDNMDNDPASTKKHIPIKLDIKSTDLKYLDSNFFSNTNKNTLTTSYGDKIINGGVDGENQGINMIEKINETKKEKKRRKRKKENNNEDMSFDNKTTNFPPLETYKNSLGLVKRENMPIFVDEFSKDMGQTRRDNRDGYICNIQNNGNDYGVSDMIENNEITLDNNYVYEKNKLDEMINENKRAMEAIRGGSQNIGGLYDEYYDNNVEMGNKIKKVPTSVNNINSVNEGSNINEVEKNNNLFYPNMRHNNKTIFQFDDIINPHINRNDYLFCLSKYASVQKRILFYLENILNFDTFNFKSKKGDDSAQNPSKNTSQNSQINIPPANNDIVKNVGETKCD
ncbi:conserved protein, unknown function [Plasmodium yoelii]|uniref:Enhancer of polycomb-like protein n=2 Tax=Plasmodium yoelii TaxID=5861 RepID=A0AAE9WYT7_PLAYO|nr:conserved protein, unknown function [Plasmodium yoelii]WBY60744.1 hypothetical protein Py17XNL_001401020 [Plasmodium yoelii yoelii]CDU20524.1 conserved Plasmodium protein, unknown function [Plasmodium yoelii]VTZ81485.1 conserved protein, unknown function [Plasmodium yoelii]|eukprot:XP_022812865.1 conserved protein, unknown function [Plasmodium yoelii]